MLEITRKLADWVTKTGYEDLPQEVRTKVKFCALDCAGVALSALGGEVGRIVDALLPEMGVPGGSTVFGSDKLWKPVSAGFFNGLLAHAMDFDDTYQPVPVHTSSAIFPASLAMAENLKASGKDLIRAMALGTEISIRIGLALGRTHIERGWHGTGTFNTFGAAVSAGTLLGFSAPQMIRCLGTAGVQAAGLVKAAGGNKCKPLHAGKAAMNGILSALLAASSGWSAPERVIEMEKGFASAFSDKPQLERGLEGLGTRHLLMDISLKPNASCAQTHSTVDGMKELRLKNQIDPEAVREIILKVNPLAVMVAGFPQPKDGLEGKFSLAYCAALVLHGHDPVESAFSDTMVKRPELQATCQKVRLEEVPGRGDVESETEIQLKDGRRFSTYVSIAKGNPGNELSVQELSEKFSQLVEPFAGQKVARSLMSTILRCEEMKDVRELGHLLRRASLQMRQNSQETSNREGQTLA